MPKVADGVPVRYLDPAAPWAALVGAVTGGSLLQAGIALRVNLLFDDAKAGIRQSEEWEAVITPLGEIVEVADAITVDHDDRDFPTDAPAGARYVSTAARIGTKIFYTDLSKRLKDLMVRERTLTVAVNRELKLWGRVGESDVDFAAALRRGGPGRGRCRDREDPDPLGGPDRQVARRSGCCGAEGVER